MGNSYLESDIYFRYINSQNNDDLYVLTFGYEKCDKLKLPIISQQKTHFTLIFIISGHGEFVINNINYKLGENDVFITFPNIICSYWQTPNDPWEYIWFEFSGLKAKFLLEEAMLTSDNPVYNCKSDTIKSGLLELFDKISNPTALELNSLSHLFKILSQLINERNTDVKNNMSQKQMSINFVKYYIANNLSNNELSLTEISDKLHVNPSYLSRIFKEVTGTTLSKYIITLRMHKACELLEKKLYSVKDITFMVGYSDPHYFSTEFSEHIGICPKNYTSEGIFKKM